MSEKPILGILMGDSAGVGPELVAKLADAPTLSEVGDYNDVEVPVWRGVAAPGAMSEEAAAFWSGILAQVAESEQWKTEYLDKNMLIGNYMDYQTAQEFMAQYQADYLASIGK